MSERREWRVVCKGDTACEDMLWYRRDLAAAQCEWAKVRYPDAEWRLESRVVGEWQEETSDGKAKAQA